MISSYKELSECQDRLLACYRTGSRPSDKFLARITQLRDAIQNGSKLTRVYVSGPITKGSRATNFHQAAKAQTILMESGKYAVLNPMLTMMHPDEPNISWERWLDTDLAWIEVADLVIRLPGESAGGDKETAYARQIGVPVAYAYEIPELREAFPAHYTTPTV